jgi:hypothetical protein
VYINPPLPSGSPPPFYFGAFGANAGPLRNLTDPFIIGLTKTSWDGGVVFFNVPPLSNSDGDFLPYTITAEKEGVNFSPAIALCRPGIFVNCGPPWGPQVDGPMPSTQ